MLFYWGGSIFFVLLLFVAYLYKHIKSNKKYSKNTITTTTTTNITTINTPKVNTSCDYTNISDVYNNVNVSKSSWSRFTDSGVYTNHNNVYLLPEYQESCKTRSFSQLDCVFNSIYSVLDELNDKELIQEFAKNTQTNCRLIYLHKIEKLVDAVHCKIRQSYDCFDDFIDFIDDSTLTYFNNVCSQLFLTNETMNIFRKYIKFLHKEDLIEKKIALEYLIRLMKKLK